MQYFFYLFASSLIMLSSLVISSKNPVHSVLFLILVFVNSTVLFLLLNAEFVAMLLIIVYVGAVAVLFLFIVIMLGVETIKKKFKKKSYLALIPLLALLCELCWVYFKHDFFAPNHSSNIDIYMIGNVLYTDYFYLFQMAGLILLIAMVGAIVLTLKTRSSVHKQKVISQLLREPDIKLVKS
ncbi:MAG: NADH-quinone oxidoreductase subunit J [Rickettsiaceae bacterium H1]|nr:NADH-quinone oxidoreductase subunit J [Rickettsiaceae bacterium H1]